MHRSPLAALTLLAAAGAPALAQDREPLEVEIILRDFSLDHPDFQREFDPNVDIATPGLVAPELDDTGRPVLSEMASLLTSEAREIESAQSFDQWYRNLPGVNRVHRRTLRMDFNPATGFYSFRDLEFFPLNGLGPNPNGSDGPDFGFEPNANNFYFTTEVDTSFLYTDPRGRDHRFELTFTGDDDLWIFINGRLALDLGGTHFSVSGTLDVDDLAEEFGLEPGSVNRLQVFHAERRQQFSAFELQTNFELAPSILVPLYD